MREFLNLDLSATAAEARARASDSYGKALDELAHDLRSAELVIAKYHAVQTKWESARSVLSSLKNLTNL